MKENILRENDIRGRYPNEINEETVRIIGHAFAYYIKEHNYNIETIRNFLITNPQLVSMSPEEFKNIVKFN